MEGVPRIPMLGFPLKRSADVPDFRSNIKRFISEHYNEDPEAYNTEISTLDSLRAGAVHLSRDFTGCATLKKYFCQLHYLKSRFPFQEGSQIVTTFSWYDVHSDTVHGWKDIDFEMSCILYNIGALHSELGTKDTRLTADGMKTSCTHFQCAAWAFQHLKNDYRKFFSPDLSSDILSIMSNICLAQAQECILEKSLIDNRKSAITAKVSLQIVEYYQQTVKTIDAVLKKTSPSHSDKVIKAAKKWRDLVEVKMHYYGSLSYLYRGLQSEEQTKFGERVTFFKAAMDKLTDASKLIKSMDKSDSSALLAETLNFTTDVIGTKLSSSEKENEFIYHEKVPELESLGADFKGVSLVKGIPFKFDDPDVSGPDIFARLVPMEAHEASSLYSEEKAKIMRQYASKIEEKNEALERFLLAMQLDQLDLHSEETKIPQALVDCCAALSVNPEAVKKLSSLMSKLSGMFHDVEHNIKEISELLKAEDVKEKEFQEIVGKRPPNNLLTELSREVKKYQHAHSVASESNQTLHEAMRVHVLNLQILMKPLPEVLKHIPSVAEIEEKDEIAINEMKRLRSKIEEMQKQRDMLMNQLRESILNDDITKSLVVKQDQVLETVFEEELKKHEKIMDDDTQTQFLDQNMVAQENILRSIVETNATYAATRKATEEVLMKRNKSINALLGSYDAYNELLIKCTQGVEFYTKLDANVTKLLQRVRSACKVQEEEREERTNAIIKTTQQQQSAKETTNDGVYPKGYPTLNMYSNYAAAATTPDVTSNQNIMDNAAIQQQYEKNLALQQEYERNLALQQEYEKNLALQQEYAKLAKLRQQIAKESTVQYGTNYSAGHQYSTDSTPTYMMTTASMPGQYGVGSNSVQYYGAVSSPGQNQQQQYGDLSRSQVYPTNLAQAYSSANNISQQYPSSVSAKAYEVNSSQTYQAPCPSSNSITSSVNNISQQYPRSVSAKPYEINSSQSYPTPCPSSNTKTSSTNNISQQYPSSASAQPYQVNSTQTYQAPCPSSYPITSSSPQQYVFANSSIATSSSQQQPYLNTNSTTTPPYMTTPFNIPTMNYSTNSSGVQPYAPISSTTSDVPSSSPQIYPSSTVAASFTLQSHSQQQQPQYPQTVDHSVVTQQQYGHSHNPLLQQYSQQYDQPTAVHNDSCGNYPILQQYKNLSVAQNQYGQPNHCGSNLFNYAPSTLQQSQQQTQSVYDQQQQQNLSNQSNMYLTHQGGYSAAGPAVAGSNWNYSMTNNNQQLPPAGQDYMMNGYMNYYGGQTVIPGGAQQQQDQPQRSGQNSSSSLETIYAQKIYEATTSNQSGLGDGGSSSSLVVSSGVSMPQKIEQAAESQSNIDLLADVDLTMIQKPLVPSCVPSSGTSTAAAAAAADSGHKKEEATSCSLNLSTANNSNYTSIISLTFKSDQNVDKGDPHLIPDEEEDNLSLTSTNVNEKQKPVIDHLADPVALATFKYDVENFEHNVKGLSKHGSSNLDVKWREVIDIQNTASTKMSISVARCYNRKNRFPDILPYDQTRVPLPCTKDDYINASFVKGISTSAIPFIATQAPLPATFSDFWHLVWYHHVDLIVCLASDIDLKEHIYWPLEKGKDLVFGPLTISLQSKNVKPSFVERIFSITHGDLKQTRVTIHLQLTTWPGNVFPENLGSLVNFVNEVHSYFLQQRSLSRPVVVHCIPGVGKTGAVVILSAAIREIQNANSFPDLTVIAAKASEQRKMILNDKEYLRFSYQALLYYCQDLLMKRGILPARAAFDEQPTARHLSRDFMTEMKNIVKPDANATNGNGEEESEFNSHCVKNNSLPSTPSHRSSGRQEDDVRNTPRGRIYSDIPASLMDVEVSTFQKLTIKDTNELKRNDYFESRKGALTKKIEVSESTLDPLDSLDPLWTLKK